jgi:dissimilatory sulfite reductase (desulfoviridin) alpha/beta subunit
MNAAIAQHLNVAESAIIRVEEWANVLFAVVKGIGARFVSKKVVKVDSIEGQIQERKITSSFSEVWEYLKANGKRQGAKLNYRIQVAGVEYTVKEIDSEWRVSASASAHSNPFTGIKN